MFEPNEGQAPTDAAFVVRAPYPVFLWADRAVLVMPNNASLKDVSAQPPRALSLQLVGSNKAALSEVLDQLPGKSNYYIVSRRTELEKQNFPICRRQL